VKIPHSDFDESGLPTPGQLSRRSAMVAGLTAGLATAGLLPGLTSSSEAATKGAYDITYVSFDDIAPSYLTLTQSWNALGKDDQDRVYIIWTSTRTDGREDAALFRYTQATRKREFLGTFIDAATADNNIVAGEQIPKGHTRILQVGRKMYMASQGFHDFKGSIDALPTYRGAHLFSLNLDNDKLKDESSTVPGGVLIEHQGIVALSYSPEHNMLVGLAHPLGDIVLYDLAKKKVSKVVPGIPWQLNHVVSREIIVTRQGKVYTYRGPEEPVRRAEQNEVWVYNLATGKMAKTGQSLKGGFWNGQAPTPDGKKVYVSTVSGELYVLDTATGIFTHLGHFMDPADYNGSQKYRVQYLYGISLNSAGNAIVGLPIIAPSVGGGDAITRMTTYNLVQKTFTKQVDPTATVFTGSNTRDRVGNIYLAAFEWDHNCRLAILRPPYRRYPVSRQPITHHPALR
jgi:DNA-binding beta-propeller fold protein YncE